MNGKSNSSVTLQLNSDESHLLLEALDYRAETYAQMYLASGRQKNALPNTLETLEVKVSTYEALLDRILKEVPEEWVPKSLPLMMQRRRMLLTQTTTKGPRSNP